MKKLYFYFTFVIFIYFSLSCNVTLNSNIFINNNNPNFNSYNLIKTTNKKNKNLLKKNRKNKRINRFRKKKDKQKNQYIVKPKKQKSKIEKILYNIQQLYKSIKKSIIIGYRNTLKFITSTYLKIYNFFSKPKNIKIMFYKLIDNTSKYVKGMLPVAKKVYNNITLEINKNIPGIKSFFSNFIYSISHVFKNIYSGITRIITNINNSFRNFNETRKNKKESPVINIAIQSSLLNSIENKLKKEIIKDFLYKNGYYSIKFIKITKSSDYSQNINILLEKNVFYNYSNFTPSLPVLSNGIYFLLNPDYNKTFNFPNSLYYNSVGVQYLSNEERFLKTNYNLKQKPFYYSSKNTMIQDFKNKRFMILILNRFDYYQNIKSLPSKVISSINIGTPYNNFYFSNTNMRNKFNLYLQKRKNRYEWKKHIYRESQKLKFLNKYLNEKNFKKLVLFCNNFGKNIRKIMEKLYVWKYIRTIIQGND